MIGIRYRPGQQGTRWRWWHWENHYGKRKPHHARPHIGRRRTRRVRYTDYNSEGDAWWGYGRRGAAGRPLALQRPAYELHVETVPAGPYEEQYAGYRATAWWQRKVLRWRERRGVSPIEWYAGLYRAHPLQGGKR